MRLGGALVTASVAGLDFDGDDHVVDAAEDVVAQEVERAVEFLYDGVCFGAFVLEAVALELDGVVLRDLALDRLVVDAEVGGNKVVGASGVGEVLLNEEGDAQLGVVLQGVGAVAGRLAHVARGHRADVDDLVVAAVGFEFGFDAAEFAADDLEAFVDECGGVDGHLVFIVDRLFVVDLNDGVEQGDVELGRAGGDGDVDDCTVLFLLTDAEVAGDAVDGGHLGELDDVDFAAEPRGGNVGCGAHDGGVALDFIGFVVCERRGRGVAVGIDEDEAGGGGVDGDESEAERLLGVDVGEGDFDGCAAVDVDVAEADGGGVKDVGASASYDLLEQTLRLELEDFVGDVDAVDRVFVTVEAAGRCLI